MFFNDSFQLDSVLQMDTVYLTYYFSIYFSLVNSHSLASWRKRAYVFVGLNVMQIEQ
jgi:hypothetical protein